MKILLAALLLLATALATSSLSLPTTNTPSAATTNTDPTAATTATAPKLDTPPLAATTAANTDVDAGPTPTTDATSTPPPTPTLYNPDDDDLLCISPGSPCNARAHMIQGTYFRAGRGVYFAPDPEKDMAEAFAFDENNE